MTTTTNMTMDQMKFIGWGLIGAPQDSVLVETGNGKGLDVSGYHTSDYWDGETFLGPDAFGIVPVYETADGCQFPSDARLYPYTA